jgi:hypothetical protein
LNRVSIVLIALGFTLAAGLSGCSWWSGQTPTTGTVTSASTPGSDVTTTEGLVSSATTEPSSVWTGHTAEHAPPGSHLGSMIFDPVAGNAVLSMGMVEMTPQALTYLYDPGADAWTSVDTPFARRFGQAMVYDPAGKRTILFGGAAEWPGSKLFGDIWAYDSQARTWAELVPKGTAPAVRWGHSLAYDPASGKIILFGGVGWKSSGAATFNDTWSFDPATDRWARLKTRGTPPARYGHSMVYDPSSGKIIMFGGLEAKGRDAAPSLPVDDKTWAFDPKTKTWAELPQGPGAPGLRVGPTAPASTTAMGASPAGTGAGPASTGGTGPSARCFQAMVYDSTTRKIILFGGCDGPGGQVFSDTWAYDPATNIWTLESAGALLGRWGHSMAYDPDRRQVILFGGMDKFVGGEDVGGTWLYYRGG